MKSSSRTKQTFQCDASEIVDASKRKAVKVIHYAGALRTARLRLLPGFAACCYGEKAVKIREQGNHTYDTSSVTCRACKVRIAGSVAWEKATAMDQLWASQQAKAKNGPRK